MSTWRSGTSPVLTNACGTPGGTDHDLAGAGLELLVAERVQGLALLDDADLGVRVAVQRRAAAGRRLHEDERDALDPVVVADELAGAALGAGQAIVRDDGHRGNPTRAALTPGAGPVHCRRCRITLEIATPHGPARAHLQPVEVPAARSCSGHGAGGGVGREGPRRRRGRGPARRRRRSRWSSSRTAWPDAARPRRPCSSTPPGSPSSRTSSAGPFAGLPAGHGRPLRRRPRRLPHRRDDRARRRALPRLPAAPARTRATTRRSRACPSSTAVDVPTLVVQGISDPFGMPPPGPAARSSGSPARTRWPATCPACAPPSRSGSAACSPERTHAWHHRPDGQLLRQRHAGRRASRSASRTSSSWPGRRRTSTPRAATSSSSRRWATSWSCPRSPACSPGGCACPPCPSTVIDSDALLLTAFDAFGELRDRYNNAPGYLGDEETDGLPLGSGRRAAAHGRRRGAAGRAHGARRGGRGRGDAAPRVGVVHLRGGAAPGAVRAARPAARRGRHRLRAGRGRAAPRRRAATGATSRRPEHGCRPGRRSGMP